MSATARQIQDQTKLSRSQAAAPADPIAGTKTCTRCGHIKPLDDFYLKRATAWNHQHRTSQCKDCVKAATRQRKPSGLSVAFPCDDCAQRALCATTGHQCDSFCQYVTQDTRPRINRT